MRSVPQLRPALLCLLVLFMFPSRNASAQTIDKLLGFLRDQQPQTIHSIIELDYFPSVDGAKYGHPVIRFDLNYAEEGDARQVGELYYHGVWGNAVGYGGHGVVSLEEFISAGVSYKPTEWLAGSATWEPIGIYVNPTGGLFGSGLTLQVAIPMVVFELNERAQGMGTGFLTQREQNGRMRNIKARIKVGPYMYISLTRQGIGMNEGPLTSIAFGAGI